MKKYANDLNIKIIGDLPMYVDYHSVDLWSHPHLFHLDSHTMKPTFVSGLIIQSMFSLISRLNWLGFPANDDYDIQIWNQPVYRWNEKSVENDLFTWWIKRLSKMLSIVDILRIDHFRGFISHYVIPMDIDTQKPQTSNAHWIDTP